MTEKEIGEIRRRTRRERSNMTAIYGCFVNDQKEIITEYRQSTAMMSENGADRYFGLMRRILSGTVGKNLLDITFKTSQVANSQEHKLLMDLRATALKDDDLRLQLYRKIIENTHLDTGYLILLGSDTYDVPFKSKDDCAQADNSSEVYTYVMCAVCPVKQTKAALHYVAEDKQFQDGGISQVAQAPAFGFLFPAFDNRATNIYNALFYTHDVKTAHAEVIDSLFQVTAPMAAAEQKKSFEALLSNSLGSECSMEVVQNVHDQLCQCIELHKEDKTPATLMVSKEQVKTALVASGVSEDRVSKFSVEYDEVFGFEADLHPKNVIDSKKFEIRTPDVSIKVSPERSDLIETRIIGGVKYILICADENVEVNGVNIHIGETEDALV